MYRLVNKMMVALGFGTEPQFLIAGTQKAGTTALFDILSQHSQLHPSVYKETHYFHQPDWNNYFSRMRYRALFPLSFQLGEGGQCFESTPDYLYRDHIASRIKAFNPEMKFIIMLREPVERAWSAWSMFYNTSKTGITDPRTFQEAVDFELDYLNSGKDPEDDNLIRVFGYLFQGMYHRNIEAYFRFFPRENFLFLENRELLHDFPNAIGQIEDFLGIRKENLQSLRANEGKGHEMDPELNKKLKKVFEPHNQKTFELIGKSYDW